MARVVAGLHEPLLAQSSVPPTLAPRHNCLQQGQRIHPESCMFNLIQQPCSLQHVDLKFKCSIMEVHCSIEGKYEKAKCHGRWAPPANRRYLTHMHAHLLWHVPARLHAWISNTPAVAPTLARQQHQETPEQLLLAHSPHQTHQPQSIAGHTLPPWDALQCFTASHSLECAAPEPNAAAREQQPITDCNTLLLARSQ